MQNIALNLAEFLQRKITFLSCFHSSLMRPFQIWLLALYYVKKYPLHSTFFKCAHNAFCLVKRLPNIRAILKSSFAVNGEHAQGTPISEFWPMILSPILMVASFLTFMFTQFFKTNLRCCPSSFIKTHFPNHVQGTCGIRSRSIEVRAGRSPIGLESNGLGLRVSNEFGA